MLHAVLACAAGNLAQSINQSMHALTCNTTFGEYNLQIWIHNPNFFKCRELHPIFYMANT